MRWLRRPSARALDAGLQRRASSRLKGRLIIGSGTTATFTFAKGQYDDEFYALDNTIAATAKATPGYLGVESWENPSTGLVSNVHYWEPLEALAS